MSLIVKNDLYDYKNRYIYQEKNGFKFSLDSLLLAEFVNINNKDYKILDMCTGNAVIPLVLSTYNNSHIVGVEIQPEVANLAKMSVEENKLTDKIDIFNVDVNEIDNYFPNEFFDIITCNPPYFKVENKDYINDTKMLSIARHEISLKLENVFKIAAKMLKNKGEFYLSHRVTRIDEIIILAHKYNINVKVIQLIRTKENSKPTIALIKCIKASKYGVIFNKEMCVNNLSTYQHLFKEV